MATGFQQEIVGSPGTLTVGSGVWWKPSRLHSVSVTLRGAHFCLLYRDSGTSEKLAKITVSQRNCGCYSPQKGPWEHGLG